MLEHHRPRVVAHDGPHRVEIEPDGERLLAVRHWVTRGCRDDERDPLVDAALGALEGALGDWGR